MGIKWLSGTQNPKDLGDARKSVENEVEWYLQSCVWEAWHLYSILQATEKFWVDLHVINFILWEVGSIY